MSGSNLQRNEAFAINPYAPPSAPLEDVRRLQGAPPLWNPDAAANWSLLLTPAFGAYLHMRNWQALGDSSKAAASRRWMIAIVVLTCTLTVISALLPESQALTALVRAGSVALLFGWYFASAREQARYIKERYGTNYPRRAWLRPMLAAVLTIIGVFALMFVGVFVVSFVVVLVTAR